MQARPWLAGRILPRGPGGRGGRPLLGRNLLSAALLFGHNVCLQWRFTKGRRGQREEQPNWPTSGWRDPRCWGAPGSQSTGDLSAGARTGRLQEATGETPVAFAWRLATSDTRSVTHVGKHW